MVLMSEYKLYKGDCLEVLNEIQNNSIDLILCDLPYGTTENPWDSVIPTDKLWEHYNRILTNQSSVLLFGSEPFSTKLRISNFKNYKYDWIWKKNKVTGFIHAKNKPLKDYEIISVFSNSPMGHASTLHDNRMRYNPQGLVPCNKINKCGKKFGSIVGKRPSQKECILQEYTNYPKMTLEFNSESGLHPSQKPVPLLEYLIKTYTDEGMTVLDNCMGSGSTGVACLNTNRNFIGIELDDKYFQIADNRLREAMELNNESNSTVV